MLYELTPNEVGIINIIRNMGAYDKITIQQNGKNDKIEFKVHYDQSVFFKRNNDLVETESIIIACGKEIDEGIDFSGKKEYN